MAGAKKPKAGLQIVVDDPVGSTAETLAKAKWQSSGISSEAARLLKLKGLQAPETRALGPRFHPVASLHIPYFDFDGNPTEFYRVRYLEPLPGFAAQAERPQRYAQAPGTLNEVYLPPLLARPWSEIAGDPTTPIYITEGELKAAAATQAGYPTIGLGGVDVWRSSKRGVALLPQLKAIQWTGRNVVILFDSDAAENPSVVNAQRRLAGELLALGAVPRIAALPADDGGKVGLDDFLLVQGSEALKAVIDAAPAFPEAEALWALNEEVVYSRSPGIVIVRASGRRMAVNDFTRHVYANRHFMEQVTTPAGRVTFKKQPLAPRWIEWEHRFEVDEIVYEPGHPRLYEGRWNAWPGWGADEKQGSVKLWDELLDYIFPYDPDSRRWFEQWVAYPIQHPGTKLYTSVVLWSTRHGTGKTLLAYLIKSVYGLANSVEITSENLRASFNGWAENKQFVIGDEITAGDARIDKDKLKFIITRKEILINQKYLPEYVIRDCVNYLFNSNSPDALFVEDSDRRHFVQEIVNDPMPREFYEECDAWLKGDAAANLLHHLRRVDLKGFNPREHAPMTVSKRNMIIAGKSELGMWVQELKEDPKTKLRPLGDEIASKCELFSPGQLLRAYDPEGNKRVTAPGLARELIRAGFRPLNGGSPIRTRDTTVRLYAIRNQRDWIARSPKVMAEHFEKFALDAQKF